jgi:hypothetical protein
MEINFNFDGYQTYIQLPGNELKTKAEYVEFTKGEKGDPGEDGADGIDGVGGASGCYTPTLYNTTNISASVAYPLNYCRVGDMVTVSGHVDIDPVTASAFSLGISLPIASDLTAVGDCTGAGGCADYNASSRIAGDTTNNRAKLEGISPTTGLYALYFSFSYIVK